MYALYASPTPRFLYCNFINLISKWAWYLTFQKINLIWWSLNLTMLFARVEYIYLFWSSGAISVFVCHGILVWLFFCFAFLSTRNAAYWDKQVPLMNNFCLNQIPMIFFPLNFWRQFYLKKNQGHDDFKQIEQ